MFYRSVRVERSFTISVADLLFQIRGNTLLVGDSNGVVVNTPITSDEIDTLVSFCEKTKDILNPIPGSTVVYVNDAGPQKITLMRDEKGNYLLILNNQLQFTTQSEEIYHEALVGPVTCSVEKKPTKFLILGGGDGLVAKQIFKENPEAEVVLVDFDKTITDLFTDDIVMKEFNEDSMIKCKVINDDAFEFVKSHTTRYDVIICDFPDPDHEIFNKLYSLEFYNNVKNLLVEGGALAVQSGSLVNESKSFKCIQKTIEASGFNTITFYTPSSYGDLVYTIGRLDKKPTPDFSKSIRKYKTLSQEFFEKGMCTFRPGAYSEEDVEINTVENFAALDYRTEELKS
jgi:spermidine synthase